MRTAIFVREPLRAPFTLVLLITVPALFVASAAGVLSDFARVLGGSLGGNAAVTLSAGWAAAFVAGTLGFFESASSRGADRRLVLAGAGPGRVALARIGASLTLALLASAAAFTALVIRTGAAHPAHAAVGIMAFAVIYVAVGVIVGSLVRDPLEGSLLVAFVFLLDAFSGPGMSASPPVWAVSQKAADVLIAAGSAQGSSGPAWGWLAVSSLGALALAFAVFAGSCRRRA